MLKGVIEKAIQKATGVAEVHLEVPELEEHGDYSSNVAMILGTKKKEDPKEVAKKVIAKLEKDGKLRKIVSKIEVAGPGFINFWLREKFLVDQVGEVIDSGEGFGRDNVLKGKKILLEHTSPNTIKMLHLGHVRNNILGMAVHNILEFCGAEVTLDAINNDRGIHVMKAVWAYLQWGHKGYPNKEPSKPVDCEDRLKEWVLHSEDWREPVGKGDTFVDHYYVMGAEAERLEKEGAEDYQGVKEEMQGLLRRWEAGDEEVLKVWKKLRDWTFEGFKETYERLGSMHDYQWLESNFYKEGKEIVEVGLKKRVFKKLEDGAVLSQLEKYKLPDAIVMRADGTSMYHTQDLRLTQLKREKFPSDLYIWDIGPEQALYLKQLFAMCEQLGIGKREDYLHMPYGFVYLKGKGRMSSRKGTVISADWLMEEVVKKARNIIDKSETGGDLPDEEKGKISEAVGIGAIKYAFLKPARLTDIQFDIDESVSLEGNSGPYLQYTYARTQSVLRKAKSQKQKAKSDGNSGYNQEEMMLMRSFPHFSEVIIAAAKNYSPNLLCNYLYDLASKYNNFYAKHRILGSKDYELRIMITKATGQILKNGLGLLGIDAPEKM